MFTGKAIICSQEQQPVSPRGYECDSDTNSGISNLHPQKSFNSSCITIYLHLITALYCKNYEYVTYLPKNRKPGALRRRQLVSKNKKEFEIVSGGSLISNEWFLSAIN